MKIFYKKLSVKPACSRFLMLPIFFVLLILAGCGSHKNVVKTVSRKDTQKVEQFLLQNSSFQTMESKVEFKFTARKGVDARMKGSFKMWKDSCIIFSVQPFAGFEAVKCLISKDSIVLVSRLHQVYSVEYLPDSEWKEYLNIATLQSIFCNNIFVPGDAHPDARKLARFESHSQKEGPSYRWAEDSFILDFLMTKDNLYYRLKGFRPEKKETVLVNYGSFEEEAIGVFPHQVDLSTEGFSKNWQMQIFYLKPSFDAKTDFRFDVPAKYKKVTTKELIQRFQNLL